MRGTPSRGAEEGGLTYRDAGVDLDAARETKGRLAKLVESTRTAAVTSTFGSFGGRFRSTPGRELVASADGVGTKLKVAFLAGRHDSVGVDLVHHCVDDILTEGAVPLVFLDYIACGTLDPEVVTEVVSGLAAACRGNGCALVGGETAEMPDFYAPGEYDLAGFVVGETAFPEVASRRIAPGDRLIGLASSGFHTNGYSLLRRIVFERLGLGIDDPFPETGRSVGEVLLEPHRSYLGTLRPALEAGRIRALAHITGGGIPGNLDRILGERLSAVVDAGAWEPPPEFRVVAEASGAGAHELYRTLNMGIGMIAVVEHVEAEGLRRELDTPSCPAFLVGEIVRGDGTVRMEGG